MQNAAVEIREEEPTEEVSAEHLRRSVTIGVTVTRAERELLHWYAAVVGTTAASLLFETSAKELIERAKEAHRTAVRLQKHFVAL